jgi:hypothetical protein
MTAEGWCPTRTGSKTYIKNKAESVGVVAEQIQEFSAGADKVSRMGTTLGAHQKKKVGLRLDTG